MTNLILVLVAVGFLVFWLVKKPKVYKEPLPSGDPKSPDFKKFWNRHGQNQRRFRIGCFSYVMFVSVAMLIYWLNQNYAIINVNAKANPSPTQTVEVTATPTPSPTRTRAANTVQPSPTATSTQGPTATPRIVYQTDIRVVTVVVPQPFLITQEVTRIITATFGPTQTPWIVTATFTATPTATLEPIPPGE